MSNLETPSIKFQFPMETFQYMVRFDFISDSNANGSSQTISPCPLRAPLVVTIVGLPCRGKSMAAKRISRHLCWKGEYAKGL